MCDSCVRRGRRSRLSRGRVNVYAHSVYNTRYGCVPLFVDSADNYAIEGAIYLIRRSRTARHYRRSGRRVNEI